ncbi:TIGR03809 family protein [Undibacter mobilis]|uniref:TIGR03809 family protein n=1 Tax=Undibacter mobilis TaxID=2292256 RepID=A0A371B3Q5_9BRAD|nr:TIGR03809 family protein [Undibacter mobilis]RDV02209.1 TIGR03809 family protein [Undibacter mobilis]
MRTLPGSTDLERIARRWHDLAEQRLAYYTELYRSGRWKHYYTQESFAVRMLDVIEDAKKWRQLAGRPMAQEPAQGEPAREMSVVRSAA